MAIRPIDIARKLGISTTTLRTYEEMGLVPPALRSKAGYRIYTEEHAAYFACIREMLPGFGTTTTADILKQVIAGKIDAAYRTVNKAQADLRQQKNISKNIIKHLYDNHKSQKSAKQATFTIHEISRETGVPITTIRYWDKVGLISANRCPENNYRVFTYEHVRQVLAISALKLSAINTRYKYFVDKVKEEMKNFDYEDKDRILEISKDINKNLDKFNALQIRGIAALHHLCRQVEARSFDGPF